MRKRQNFVVVGTITTGMLCFFVAKTIVQSVISFFTFVILKKIWRKWLGRRKKHVDTHPQEII